MSAIGPHHAALVEALRRGEEKLAAEIAAEQAGKNFGFPDGVEATTRRAWALLLPQAVLEEVADRRPAQRSSDKPPSLTSINGGKL